MNNSDFDFNKAFGEVQAIHKWFQSDEFSLEEGIKKFKTGMELLEKCMQRVQEAENEFVEVQKKYQTKIPAVSPIESNTDEDSSTELF